MQRPCRKAHNFNRMACTDATRCVRGKAANGRITRRRPVVASYGRRTLHPQQNTENLYFVDKEGGMPLIVT